MASPVDDGGDLQGPALTVAAVARRLGVAPATLRTWDRRYGLGPSAHTAGAHRRYTASDLQRLSLMRRLTHEGVAPAEAARIALAAPEGAGGTLGGVPLEAAPAPAAAAAGVLAQAGAEAPEAAAGRRAPGGGRVLALPDGSPPARGLARAAMALDSHACLQIVTAALERSGVVQTWDELLVPVLVGVGERWSASGQGIEVEHLLSECVMAAMRGVSLGLASPRNARPVLLSCAPEDQHVLPVHVLAAALAERGVGARLLGARVPADALVAAVRRSGPAAVFVWAQMPATADPAVLSGLPVLRPPAVVVAGGPGWDRAATPADVVAEGLEHAVDVLVRATGG
ncbi:MerR family transcriptional regulator [Vallicoccus soli]|uniref:MerR family transcriptional regulator n=1 Tax=Vallicoccus soli TaxID=2339232 RepID=A0A3A3ZBW5_9ACTN|nr:MerR family transcriptional regulator [Vallicoccus soli]RJK92620.1 MerR family transcriptional regulator [Vallicoccus soli]